MNPDHDQQPRKRFGRPSTLLGWVSNVVLIFSTLSTLAHLDSWADARALLARLSAELVAIGELIGRVVHTLLIPWIWLRDLAFRLVPLRIPDDWKDPVLLGFFIIGLFLGSGAIAWIGRSTRWVLGGTRFLEQAIVAAALEPDRKQHAEVIQKVLVRLDAEPWAIGPVVDLLRALRAEDFPEDLLIARGNRALKDVVAWRERLESNWKEMGVEWKKERRKLRIRALVAAVLLLALGIDQLAAGAGFVALSILWRSLVVFVIFSVVGVVLGMVVWPLIVLIAKPLSAILSRIPWVRERLELQLLPWFLRQVRGDAGQTAPSGSASTAGKSSSERENSEAGPLFAREEVVLRRLAQRDVAVLSYSKDRLSLARLKRVEHETDKGHLYAVYLDGSREHLATFSLTPEGDAMLRRMPEILLRFSPDNRVLDSELVPLRHMWMA